MNPPSPRPWQTIESSGNCIDITDANGHIVAQVLNQEDITSEQDRANARWIVEAVNAL